MNEQKIFDEIVNGYLIPVLNNREILAAAGIIFLLAFISLVLLGFIIFPVLLSVPFKNNFKVKPHHLFQENKYDHQ